MKNNKQNKTIAFEKLAKKQVKNAKDVKGGGADYVIIFDVTAA